MSQKRILLLNTPRTFSDSLQPLLSRRGFDVDRLRSSNDALELVKMVRFDLLVLGVPFESPSLEEFLTAIRHIEAPCRTSSVVVVSEEELDPQVAFALKNGANVGLEWPTQPEHALHSIARLLEVAPRKSARFMTRLEVSIEDKQRKLLCQSENISSSGMLLRMPNPLPLETEAEIEFTTPVDSKPIKVRARVMRHTQPNRENIKGVGLAFVEYHEDSRQRLLDYLTSTGG